MSVYVEPSRPRPYGAIYVPKAPKPPQEQRMISVSEAKARAGYVAPYDIVEGARNAFKGHVLPRDVQDGRLSDGAERYFGQFYYATMAQQQVEHGVPGSAEGWGHYSVQALRAAQAAYDRDQRPQERPPQAPFRGPISTSGRDFVVPTE